MMFMMNIHPDEWVTRVRRFRDEVTACAIPPGIEPGYAKQVLAKLDSIYGEVRLLYGDILKYSKEIDRLIYRTENMNRTGGNDDARKAAAVRAAHEFQMEDGEIVSLYDMEIGVRGRLEDVEAIIDIIRKKTDMIITMSGLLKIETSLLPRG